MERDNPSNYSNPPDAEVTRCDASSSGSPLEGQIGFSRPVRVGNFIAVAGTTTISGDSSKVDTWSMYDQTRLCLQIVRKAIEEAGGQLENVIRTRIMLTDISTCREAARAHGECFSNIKPACTFVEVSATVAARSCGSVTKFLDQPHFVWEQNAPSQALPRLDLQMNKSLSGSAF